jgi:hypothetical protein
VELRFASSDGRPTVVNKRTSIIIESFNIKRNGNTSQELSFTNSTSVSPGTGVDLNLESATSLGFIEKSVQVGLVEIKAGINLSMGGMIVVCDEGKSGALSRIVVQLELAVEWG